MNLSQMYRWFLSGQVDDALCWVEPRTGQAGGHRSIEDSFLIWALTGSPCDDVAGSTTTTTISFSPFVLLPYPVFDPSCTILSLFAHLEFLVHL